MHLTCFLFFAFFDVKKRGFACKLSRYAFAGRPGIITLRHCAHGNSTKKEGANLHSSHPKLQFKQFNRFSTGYIV
jgi:hypothetical protein